MTFQNPRRDSFEGGHVNDEAEFHVVLQEAVVGFVNLLDGDEFDVAGDVMVAAKIEHFLRFANAADERAGELPASGKEVENVNGQGLGWRANLGQGSVPFQQREVGIDVVLRRNGVENEMEAVEVFFHLVLIAGDNDLVRAELQGILRFARRSGEQHHMSAKCVRKFHPHVTQAAQADNSDFFSFADFPMAQRGIGGDAGAQERRRRRQIHIPRNAQHKCFIHYDAVGVSTVSHAAALFVRGVVGEGGAVQAVLFEVVLAIFTGAARVHHATDGGNVAFLEFFDLRAGFHDASEDFVAGDARISGALPFVAGDVEVRMADAAEKNLDLDIVRVGIAALEGERSERRSLGEGGKSFGVIHIFIFYHSRRILQGDETKIRRELHE
jgi:hypothetical protein